MARGQLVRPNELPEVEIAGNQEHGVHDHVARVLRDHQLIQRGEDVHDVEEHEELHRGHRRVGDHADEARVLEALRPQARVELAGRVGFADQRERRAEHEEDGSAHREDHVHCHVRGVRGRHVHPQPGAQRDHHRGAAEQPPRRARRAPPGHAAHQVEVVHGKQQRDNAVQQLRAPLRQPVAPRERLGKVVAQRHLHRSQVRVQRRRGWGAPECDRQARNCRHDHDLHEGEAGKRAGARPQLRQRELAVREPHQAKQEDARELDHQHPAVGVVEQVGQPHPNQRIGQPRYQHDQQREQGNRGIPPRRPLEVGAQPAAVRHQRHEPADPDEHEHQVPDQRVRAKVVASARRRVTRQRQWHYRRQRAPTQRHLGKPAAR